MAIILLGNLFQHLLTLLYPKLLIWIHTASVLVGHLLRYRLGPQTPSLESLVGGPATVTSDIYVSQIVKFSISIL